MIVLAPKMYFGIESKTKSLAKAKSKLMAKFEPVKHAVDGVANKQQNFQFHPETKMFMFDFMLDNPVGIKFHELFEIYNSIPKNLMDEYLEVVKTVEKYDGDDEEMYFILNMKKQEYEQFIENYLNSLRTEAEEERNEVMQLIEEGKVEQEK